MAKGLVRVAKPNHCKRPVYAVTWDPNLQNLQGRHYTYLTLHNRSVFRATLESI